MKKIVALATLRGQLTGILSLQLADTASIADTSVPDNDNISSVSEADNFHSASARIMLARRSERLEPQRRNDATTT